MEAKIVSLSLMLVLLTLATSIEASKYQFLKLKETNMVFYMQDWETGLNATVFPIVGIPNKPWQVTRFGTVMAIDDKVTVAIERNSSQVGRLQGIYVNLALDLGCTDTAGRVLHQSLMRPDVGCGVRHGCQGVSVAFEFFLFFFFSRIRSDSTQFAPTWLWFAPIQLESCRIGQRQKQSKRSKQVEIGLESSRNSRHSHLWGILMCFLPSSFFVLWIKHSNVFLKNILIVKIYRKYK